MCDPDDGSDKRRALSKVSTSDPQPVAATGAWLQYSNRGHSCSRAKRGRGGIDSSSFRRPVNGVQDAVLVAVAVRIPLLVERPALIPLVDEGLELRGAFTRVASHGHASRQSTSREPERSNLSSDGGDVRLGQYGIETHPTSVADPRGSDHRGARTPLLYRPPPDSFTNTTTLQRSGRRLPLWTLVLVGVVLLGVAALLLFRVDSMIVFLAISPLTISGLYTLDYAGGEWRQRSDERDVR